ncbi:hypothetical protein NEUTE2DRAFT_126334 [Neurospora tetrasperma FGSC 2509]|nr:hypothetical protein NEUTE2DRAFT_126334 [Neurospora tetrasperma FGSC 2509]
MLPYTASGGRRMSPEKEASPQDSSPPTPIGGGRRELVSAPQLSTLATFTVAIQEPAPQVTVAACIQEIACHCHNRNADELPKNTMAPSNTAYPTASG